MEPLWFLTFSCRRHSIFYRTAQSASVIHHFLITIGSIAIWFVQLNGDGISLYMALLGWAAALMMRLREGKLPWLSVSLFIKTEGGGKCSKRNWWVKHPPPEELNLQMRFKVVNFNYCSRALKYKPPTIGTHLFSIISGLFVCKNITAYF